VTSIVFDTTALSHFTRAERLDELRVAAGEDEPTLLAEVAAELERGILAYPALGRVAASGWLKIVELQELPEVAAFAGFKAELGGGTDRNNGEAAVLAWVSVNGGTAIIDEEVGRRIGRRSNLRVHGSLWLLIRAFKAGILDRATTEGIVDDLVGTGMRLPVTGGEHLFEWAFTTGVLP
jgi:predicted nucleic acid-binding protein